MEIRWAKGSRFGAIDPEVAHAELERIRAKNGGELRPSDIVDEATKKRNPLHKGFVWDKDVAARKWQEHTARVLVSSIVVIREEAPDIPARQYEITVTSEIPEHGKRLNVYRTTEEILQDPESRARLLAKAKRDLASWRERYRGLHELAKVFRAIDDEG